MSTSLLASYGQTIEYTDPPVSAEQQALSDLMIAEYATLYLKLELEANPELQADLQAEIFKRYQTYLQSLPNEHL